MEFDLINTRPNSQMFLNKNEVHVWYSNVPIQVSNVERYLRIFSKEEISRYHDFYKTEDKFEFLAAHYLTRKVLSLYTEKIKAGELEFAFNRYGKPFLLNKKKPKWLNFNISHSRGLAVCAVSGNSMVGVDVEMIERDVPFFKIAECSFSSQEYFDLVLESNENKREYFYKIWCLKEAYIKARGMGLTIPLDRLTFSLKCGDVQSFLDTYLKSSSNGWSFLLLNPTRRHQVGIAIGTKNEIQVTEKFLNFFGTHEFT